MVLIDQSDDIQSLRKSEIFWQERLKTFLPNDLNEKEVALEILVTYFNSLLYYIYIYLYIFLLRTVVQRCRCIQSLRLTDRPIRLSA